MERKNVPDMVDDFTDLIIWDRINKSILLKDIDEHVTLRLSGATKQNFTNICNLIDEERNAEAKIEILKLVSDCEERTKQGVRENEKIAGVVDKFEHNCPKCRGERTFYSRDTYGNMKAECVSCGYAFSLLKEKCQSCNKVRCFIRNKEKDKIHKCRVCDYPIVQSLFGTS